MEASYDLVDPSLVGRANELIQISNSEITDETEIQEKIKKIDKLHGELETYFIKKYSDISKIKDTHSEKGNSDEITRIKSQLRKFKREPDLYIKGLQIKRNKLKFELSKNEQTKINANHNKRYSNAQTNFSKAIGKQIEELAQKLTEAKNQLKKKLPEIEVVGAYGGKRTRRSRGKKHRGTRRRHTHRK